MNSSSFHSLILTVLAAATTAWTPAQQSLSWSRVAHPGAQSFAVMATNAGGKGVLLFGVDGSTWIYENRAWVQRHPVKAPPARVLAAMAYDVRRDRVVLFGGRSGGNMFRDTWEWDGSSWKELKPTTSPALRFWHGMAYDFTRSRIVMFGGHNDPSTSFGVGLNDTWEWDGTNWIRLAVGSAPGPRGRHAMATDPLNGVVINGGYSVGRTLSETWALRGSTWIRVSAPFSPPAERDHAMTFHAATRTVIMTGGTQLPNTAWQWNGITWKQVAGRIGAGSEGTTLAYDPAGAATIAFGGLLTNHQTSVHTTSEWDGRSWQNLTFGPERRHLSASGFDPIANQVILHGGYDSSSGTRFSDSWSWDGSRWQRRVTLGNQVRFGASLEWDPVRQQLLRFGGMDSGSNTATTHVWDRKTGDWITLTPSQSPPARRQHASTSVDLPAMRGILLFGGRTAQGPLNDVWLWDGIRWASLATSGVPAARWGAAIAVEPGGNSVLVFGGHDGAQTLGDTWRLDLVTLSWTQLNPASSPSPRVTRMIHDSSRGRILLFGGYSLANTHRDGWEWDAQNSSWSPLGSPPVPLAYHNLSHGPGGSITVFGGFIPSSGSTETTWAIAPTAAAQFLPIGSGCGAISGPQPALVSRNLPYIGNQFDLRMQSLVPSAAAVAWFGSSLLPSPVTICSGCSIHVDGQVFLSVLNFSGTADLSINLPNAHSLIGVSVYVQGGAADPSYSCLSGVALTNAGRIVIGTY